ncbi:hypothetical protein K491DRAFT_782298 [Lophiostoma macrostomum CBS 122681]|uniref:Uncharacterized protein n=1 Tax=Lophiostoma macrostomum CBS 122681 TaxID=1314788 RepID=A0A6A6STF1_9PLEO|nr:hypothetical protein K491DRAFT_782298 [Lophiostoma macrostomum CBS 122681]
MPPHTPHTPDTPHTLPSLLTSDSNTESTYTALIQTMTSLPSLNEDMGITRHIWNHLNETNRSVLQLREQIRSLRRDESRETVAMSNAMLNNLEKIEENGVRGWALWVEGQQQEMERCGREQEVEEEEEEELNLLERRRTDEREWAINQAERRKNIRNDSAAGLRAVKKDKDGAEPEDERMRQIKRSESDMAERAWKADQAERRARIKKSHHHRLRGGAESEGDDTSLEKTQVDASTTNTASACHTVLTLNDLPDVHTYPSLLSLLSSIKQNSRSSQQLTIPDAVIGFLTDEANRLAALRGEIQNDYLSNPQDEEKVDRGVGILEKISEGEHAGVQGWLLWVLEKSRMKHVETRLGSVLEAMQNLASDDEDGDGDGEEVGDGTSKEGEREGTIAALRSGIDAEDQRLESSAGTQLHATSLQSADQQHLSKQEEVLSSLALKDNVEAREGGSSTVSDAGSSNSSRALEYEQRDPEKGVPVPKQENEEELVACYQRLKKRAAIKDAAAGRGEGGSSCHSKQQEEEDLVACYQRLKRSAAIEDASTYRDEGECACDGGMGIRRGCTEQTGRIQAAPNVAATRHDRFQNLDLIETPFIHMTLTDSPSFASSSHFSRRGHRIDADETVSVFRFPLGASIAHMTAILHTISAVGCTNPVIQSDGNVAIKYVDDIEEERGWRAAALKILPSDMRDEMLERWYSLGKGATFVVWKPTVKSRGGWYPGLSHWKSRHTTDKTARIVHGLRGGWGKPQRKVPRRVCPARTRFHTQPRNGSVMLRGGGEKFPDYEDSTTPDTKGQAATEDVRRFPAPQRSRTISGASSQYPRRIREAAEEFKAWTGPSPTANRRQRATSTSSDSYSGYQEPDTSEMNATSFIFFPTVSTIVLLTEPKEYIQFSHRSTLTDIREILQYRKEERMEDNSTLVIIRQILELRDAAGLKDPDTQHKKQVLVSTPDDNQKLPSAVTQIYEYRDSGLQDRRPSEKQILDAINVLRLDRGAPPLRLDQLPEDSHTDDEDLFKAIGGLVNVLDEECSSSIDWEYREPKDLDSPTYPPQPPSSPLSVDFGSDTASLASSYLAECSEVHGFSEESLARDYYRRQCEEEGKDEEREQYRLYLVDRVQRLAHDNIDLAKLLVNLDKIEKDRSHLADFGKYLPRSRYGDEKPPKDRENDIMDYVEYITPKREPNAQTLSSVEARINEYETWLRGGASDEDEESNDGYEPYVSEFPRKGKEKCTCDFEYEAGHLNHLAEFDAEMPNLGPGTYDESGNFVPMGGDEEWDQLDYSMGIEQEEVNGQRGVWMKGF